MKLKVLKVFKAVENSISNVLINKLILMPGSTIQKSAECSIVKIEDRSENFVSACLQKENAIYYNVKPQVLALIGLKNKCK